MGIIEMTWDSDMFSQVEAKWWKWNYVETKRLFRNPVSVHCCKMDPVKSEIFMGCHWKYIHLYCFWDFLFWDTQLNLELVFPKIWYAKEQFSLL